MEMVFIKKNSFPIGKPSFGAVANELKQYPGPHFYFFIYFSSSKSEVMM